MNYDTSKIDEWTLEMCRDWLAEKAEWKRDKVRDITRWTHSGGLVFLNEHPIPATLDESSKLPEGCYTSIMNYGDETKVLCTDNRFGTKTAHWSYSREAIPMIERERLARFRNRCKVESLTVRAEIN